MNCPKHTEQELARVYFGKTEKGIKGVNKFPLIDYLYCQTGGEIYKMRIDELDSRPRGKNQ